MGVSRAKMTFEHSVRREENLSGRSKLSWLLLAVLSGCQGLISDPGISPGGGPGPDPTGPTPVVCEGDALFPGRAPLRRLTVTEYDNTLRDLFGDTSEPAARLVDNERGVLSADARLVTPLLAEQYMYAAEDVAARLVDAAVFDETLGCDRAALGDDDCALDFIERTVPLAYRRPAEDGEVDRLYALYEAGRDDGGVEVGVQMVLEAMLQSPSFLYRVEIVPTGGEAVVRLTGYQLATRLSYFLWQTMPDDALFAAAEAGELDTDAGVEAHVRRMLDDPQAHATVQHFFQRFLELDKLDTVDKDVTLFPQWNEGTPDLFRQETEAFVEEVVFRGDGSWITLMTAPWSMMNADLAAYYGVSGPAGDSFERVELDAQYHSGVLTQGGVLATRARTYETSPVHRGMFIRGNVMCGVIPDVPSGLDITLPDPDPDATTRERFAAHRSDPYCASCHRQLDPLGFAFENFDAAGRFRATENDIPIDASGELTDSDNDGAFENGVDLAHMLIESQQTQTCFAERWFPQAFGRGDEAQDACALDDLLGKFRGADFDVRELLVGLALSETFLYRVADQDTVAPVMETSP